MKEIKTLSIIGLGALGILFGDHLSKKMPKEDLRIIADEERIARYEKEGIYSNQEPCHFHYVTPETVIEPADLMIFAVKYNHLPEAISAVKNHIGKDTIILSALNGISSEEMIASVYGWDKLLYSVAQGMDAVKEGNSLTYSNMGILCYGDLEPGIISEKVQKVTSFFEKMDFPHEVEKDMSKRLWGKFMLNVGVNQTVALYESNYGEIQREGKARDTMIAAMKEVIALAEKEKISLSDEDLNYWLGVLGTLSPEGKPSMRQDLEAKRYSEVGLFSGTVLELAKKHQMATPINQMLYDKIALLESQF